MRHQLQGRIIAVTGAARGIGLATATRLHAAGAVVALGDLDGAAVKKAADAIGANLLAVELDVTKEQSFQAFLEAVRERHGHLDVLVNNAGVMWVGSAVDEPEHVARRQIEVNLTGVIRGHRLALPAMIERGGGQIVTIASAASRIAAAGESTYSATKHGVLGYVTGLRAELGGTGVDVGVIMPVVVDTELAVGTSNGTGPRLTPEQVAGAVASMIRRPRAEVAVPSYFATVERFVHLLPMKTREKLFHKYLPDQRKTDPAVRADYETRQLG